MWLLSNLGKLKPIKRSLHQAKGKYQLTEKKALTNLAFLMYFLGLIG